jgi:replicative DNA helicase
MAEVDPLLKNVPPHSVEAERAVLGALMIDPSAIDDVAVLIQPEHFYRPANAIIYTTVLDLWRADKPVDVVLLNDELTKRNVLEQVGGTAALAELTEAVPTSANSAYYAKIVRDHAARRDLIKVTAEVQKDAFDISTPTDQLLDRTEKRLFEVTQQRIRSEAVPVSVVVEEAFKRLKSIKDGQGVAGLPAGFVDLDELTQGFQPGEMTILAARPSMGKCVAWDTEIVLADGSVATIEELHRRGDAELLTLGDDLKLRCARPSAYVDDGVKPVFRVTTRLGRVVETTASHPFLTFDGWRPLAELAVGVKVAVPRVLPVFGTERLRPCEVELLVGDAIRDGVIPSVVFRLERPQLAAFLVQLLDANGNSWVSERLARQVSHLLLRFGIVAARRKAASRWQVDPIEEGALVALLDEVDRDDAARESFADGLRSSTGTALLAAPRLAALATSDVTWDEVVSIEPAGEKQVYDLTIPETHNFVANDVCVHNTSLCLNILRNITVYQGRPAVFFSLEMPRLQVTSNILCSLARIDGHRLRGGYLTREEERQFLDAAEILAPAPLFIDDTPGLSTMELRAKVRRLKAQHDISFVVIDYLQLMSGSDRASQESRQMEVSEISRMIKALARELSIPIMALAQLSRKVEERKDHKPMMSDLRESGCLAGDTLVALADSGRRVPIRELVGKSGFDVWALNTSTYRLERSPVSAAFSTGVKPVFKLTTRLGRSIRATANHRFHSMEGWRRLDELGAGSRIALPRSLSTVPTQSMSSGMLYRQNVSRERLARVATVTESETLSALATSDVYWDEIVSIERDGEEEVFDLTVPDLHSFVANDIVVHNSIEQDADLIMLLFRPEYYEPDKEELKNKAEVIVAKNRNGPVGEVKMAFFNSHMRFESLTRM